MPRNLCYFSSSVLDKPTFSQLFFPYCPSNTFCCTSFSFCFSKASLTSQIKTKHKVKIMKKYTIIALITLDTCWLGYKILTLCNDDNDSFRLLHNMLHSFTCHVHSSSIMSISSKCMWCDCHVWKSRELSQHYFHDTILLPLHKNLEDESKVIRMKEIAMAQCTKQNQNNIFVNPLRTPVMYGISWPIHQVLVGLTWGWKADEI